MRIKELHSWQVTPKEAVQIQNRLRTMVVTEDRFEKIETVAGVDVGFDKKSNTGKAAIAILRLSDLSVCETTMAHAELEFPYVPGLLSFREMPVILSALAKLKELPDLFLCDGQGIAHPRRLGIACHLGLITDTPSIGVGKSRLCGKYDEPDNKKGAWSHLIDKGELIGAVLRTRIGVHPIYVSPGHRVSLPSAIDFVMQCITKYKLPETTRQAHNLSLISSRP